jgi:PAS domain S-box-containing protein
MEISTMATTPMDELRPLRAVIVEDNPDDAELIARELRRSGFETTWQRVEIEDDFVACLEDDVEIVLCDSSLPGFDAFRALGILQEREHPAPLVIVSGTISEDVAVEAMRRGAADYVLKDRLTRLGQAVTHALDRSHAEREQRVAEMAVRDAEARYRDIFESAVEGIFRVALDGRYLVVNPSFASMMGYGSPEEFLVACGDEQNFPVDGATRERQLELLLREEILRDFEAQVRRRDGSLMWLSENLRLVRDDKGKPIGLEGMSIDVTERKRAEQDRREAEEKYRTLLEQTPAIVYTWGASRGLESFAELYVSPQIERVLGFPREEWMANPTFWIDRLHPEDRDWVLAEAARCIETGEPIKMEYRMLARDGRVVWLHDEAHVVARGQENNATRFQGIQIDITERMEAEDERQRSTDQLRILDQQRRQLLTRVVTTQDEERRRIAQDIHDDTIQGFSALSIRLEALGRSYPEMRKDERFVAAERAVADSIRRLRRLIFELHPHTLEKEGLIATIRDQLAEFAKEPGSPRFHIEGEAVGELPPSIGSTAYRIVREAIVNAVKHSAATHVSIRLEQQDGGLFIQIEDDGVGFDAEATLPSGHLGLASIRERAELAGGWSRIETGPRLGTSLTFWLPVEAPRQPTRRDVGGS